MTLKPLKKILLIEDEPDIRRILQLCLEKKEKYILKYCATGGEALKKIKSFTPDLILLDMILPDMDGLSTLRELRKHPKLNQTPIIFMTAKAQPNEYAQYTKAGAIDVIIKPFDPMILPDKLRAIWKNHSDDHFNEKMLALQTKYIKKLGIKIKQIVSLWNDLKITWNQTKIENLYRIVHNLHGVSGSFNLQSLSKRAGQLERRLKPLLNKKPKNQNIKIINEQIEKLAFLSFKEY